MEAETLLRAGLLEGAVSRAYYAAFHHAEALLASQGLQARSHKGTHHLLREHFVRPGLVPRRVHTALIDVFELRRTADYRHGPVCEEEVARARIADAREVCEAVHAFLDGEGWLRDSDEPDGA